VARETRTDESFTASLGTRQRVIAGVFGIGLGVLAPFLLSVALVAGTGDLLFTIFPLPFLGVVWILQGLSPAGYTLEARGVRLERRWLSRRLPYSVIQTVDRTPRPIGGFLAFGLNALFGSHGLRWNPRTGLHYLAITNTHDLVYLRTQRGLVVLSPGHPDEFVAALAARLRGREEERS
jgi:Bacterial PH domain